MKKSYEGLEMEVIRFRTEDIITTSEARTDNNQNQDTGTNQNQNQDTGTDQNQQVNDTGTVVTGQFDNGGGAKEATHTLTPTGQFIDTVVPIYVDEAGNYWAADNAGVYHAVTGM